MAKWTRSSVVAIALLGISACSQQIEPYQAEAAQYDRQDDDKDGVINARDLCADTPIGTLIDNDGCSAEQLKQESYELMVFFAHDSSEINQRYQQQLAKVADFMQRYPEIEINVEGHTSATGSEGYNQALSLSRAEAVKRYLVEQHQIDAARVDLVGEGESALLAAGEDQQSEAANRRVRVYVQQQYRVSVPKWTVYSPELE